MKYLAYKIVEEISVEHFERRINELLREGWEPHGPMQILPRHEGGIADGLFQAMVKIARD